jgi:putative endopeptidase
MKRKLVPLLLAATIFVMTACGEEEISLSTNTWIDSDIEGFVTEETIVSEKDDFAAAANKELILNGADSNGSLGNIAKSVIRKKRDLVNNAAVTGKEIDEVRKYLALLENYDKRKELGVTPLIPYIKDIESISSVEELYGWMVDPKRNPFASAPINIEGGQRSKVDPQSFFVMLNKQNMNLGTVEEYYKLDNYNLEKMVDTEEEVTLILSQMGYDNQSIKKIIDETYQVEKKLADVMSDNSDKEEEDLVIMRGQLELIQGDYPLMQYLDNWGFGTCSLFLADENYIKALDNICNRYVEEMKSMFIVEYVERAGRYLDVDTALAFDEIEKPKATTLETDERTPEEKAEEELFNQYIPNSGLSGAMDYAYIHYYFSDEVHDRLYKMCEDLISSIGDMFLEEDWLSEEGKEAALDKLNAVAIHVVFPDDVDYSSLNIIPYEDGGNLLEAQFAGLRFAMEKEAERVTKKFDTSSWTPYNSQYSTTQTNAFYDPSTNGIYILAGILEDPVFNEDATDEELFGGIGTIVGHEITHGFDATGVNYNKYGIQQEWLPKDDRNAFDDRATRVTLFFGGIKPFPGSGSYLGNGVTGEATADMGGMKACLYAASKKENFDYDKFFRHFASLWVVQRSTKKENAYMSDVHPLNYLRINVTLSQFDKFYETYGVREGDGMYVAPDKRISVW